MQLDIGFGQWKALTALLTSERDTYDNVIDRLLTARPISTGDVQEEYVENNVIEGAYFKGVFLPNGTQLRASYKGKTYLASISGSSWIDTESGEGRNSPSEAAYRITGSAVNGWHFWMVKRPSDDAWSNLNSLRAR